MRFALEDWATLRVEGPDACEFLQGVGTQDITSLETGVARPSLFLSEKGRPVALGWVAPEEAETSFLVLLEPGSAGALPPHLDRLRVMEDVSFAGRNDAPFLLGLSSKDAEADGRRRAERLPGARILRASAMSFVLLPADSDRGEVERQLGPFASPGEWEAWRISVGIPRAGVDFGPDRIATELSLEEAISTTKGCYVGQEVVARTTHRGAVRRRRVGFTYPGAAGEFARGTELHAGGSIAGFITSSTLEPRTGRGLAMGYLATEALQNAVVVAAVRESGSTRLDVTPWPL